MANLMAVIIDDVVQLEYDRKKPLPQQQLAFLDKMDAELSIEISIGGNRIKNPDIYQKAQFVAINLVGALKESNESLAAAMCAFLANRVPGLKQVKASSQGEQMTIDLVFDEEYVRQVNVEFSPGNPNPGKLH